MQNRKREEKPQWLSVMRLEASAETQYTKAWKFLSRQLHNGWPHIDVQRGHGATEDTRASYYGSSQVWLTLLIFSFSLCRENSIVINIRTPGFTAHWTKVMLFASFRLEVCVRNLGESWSLEIRGPREAGFGKERLHSELSSVSQTVCRLKVLVIPGCYGHRLDQKSTGGC